MNPNEDKANSPASNRPPRSDTLTGVLSLVFDVCVLVGTIVLGLCHVIPGEAVALLVGTLAGVHGTARGVRASAGDERGGKSGGLPPGLGGVVLSLLSAVHFIRKA